MNDAIHLLLPLLALASPTGAFGLQDAASLLAAHRAGLGDAQALAALGTVQSRGTIAFDGFLGEGRYEELLAPGGAARVEAAFEGAPTSQTCSNGELYWMTGTGGVEIKKGWSAAADARLFALGRHRDWREVYARAELVGEAQVAGRACLEHGDDARRDENRRDRCPGGDGRAVPAHELAGAVQAAVGPGLNRFAAQPPIDVRGERVDGRVALGGVDDEEQRDRDADRDPSDVLFQVRPAFRLRP